MRREMMLQRKWRPAWLHFESTELNWVDQVCKFASPYQRETFCRIRKLPIWSLSKRNLATEIYSRQLSYSVLLQKKSQKKLIN